MTTTSPLPSLLSPTSRARAKTVKKGGKKGKSAKVQKLWDSDSESDSDSDWWAEESVETTNLAQVNLAEDGDKKDDDKKVEDKEDDDKKDDKKDDDKEDDDKKDDDREDDDKKDGKKDDDKEDDDKKDDDSAKESSNLGLILGLVGCAGIIGVTTWYCTSKKSAEHE